MRFRPTLARGVAAAVAAAVVGGALVVIPTVDPVPASPHTKVDHTVISGAKTVKPGFSKSVSGEANLVGVKWNGDPNAKFTIERRGDDGTWHSAGQTEQTDALPDPGSPDARNKPSGFASEPVWVGDDASAVRVRLVGGTARNLSLQRVVTPPSTGSSAVAGATVSNPPGIISRAQWGADESLRLHNCPGGPDYDSQLQLAIVHHTDNANNYTPDQAFQLMRSIYAYHVIALGYCDIAYNFLIDRFGRVFEGRFGGVDRLVHGAHSLAFNTNTVGIALIGNYEGTNPGPQEIDSLEALIAWKFGIHRVDPTIPVVYNTVGNDKYPPGPVFFPTRVIGHRDTWFTDCPGTNVEVLLPAVRASVITRVYTAPPDQYFGWFGVPGQPKAMAASAFGSFYPAGGQQWEWLPGYWPGFNIVRDVEIANGGVYELDGYGGIHASGAPPITGAPYFGFDVARDLVVIPGTTSGYVLDAYGAIHAFGGAPPLQAGGYWPGWDIARRMTLAPGGAYVLTAWGSVFSASQGGSTPASLGAVPYWPGWDVARDIKVRSGSPGAYVLDAYGGVHAVGGAPAINGAPYFGYDNAVGLGFATGTPGGYVADKTGQVYPFGGAPALTQAGTAFPANVRAFSVAP